MNIRELRRNPRFRQKAQRLILPVAVIAACAATADSLPAAGKTWRPVLIAQIAAAWATVGVTIFTGLYRRRKDAEGAG